MRKSRSSHVKCDCGEKTHRCMHLKGVADGHKESCCCNHGGRCTCSHKKDQPFLDPVPESDESDVEPLPLITSKGSLRGRRRANTVHADGMLTFDENGHHKPIHKHAKPSQKCSPYQLSRVHGASGSLGNRSVDNLLHLAGLGDDACSNSPASSGITTQGLRRTRSETASPLMSGSSTVPQLSASFPPPLDLSAVEFIPNPFDFFGNLSDNEQPLFSAGLSATSVDWSHYEGLDFPSRPTDDFAPSNYSQPQSFGCLEYSGSEQLPTLTTTTTTSTSGDVSESEDFLPGAGEPLDFESTFRGSTASTGFDLTQGQADLLASTNLTNLDFEQFKFVKDTADKYLPSPAEESHGLPTTSASNSATFSLPEDEPAFWMMPETSMTSIWDTQ